MPKTVQRFFTVSKQCETADDDESSNTPLDDPSRDECVTVIDKRKSVNIQCETVWSKINRKMGTVFDRRKMKRRETDEPDISERYISKHLDIALNQDRREGPTKKQRTELEQIVEEDETIAKSPMTPEKDESGELPVVEPAIEKLDVGVSDTENIEIPDLDEPIIPVTKPGKPSRGKKADKNDLIDAANKIQITDKTTLNGKLLLRRLPKPEKIVMRASPYYMTNRKLYMQKLSELFKDYNAEIAAEVSNASCERQSTEDFQALIHQRIVRDYLNIYTPYRGLLLYHGLGSGKTCTSIVIAEGMKTHRKIFIMTPASLKMNFFSELKKCGDALYKKKQYWEFVSIQGQPQNIPILSKALSLPVEFIVKQKGAWLMDTTKPQSNYGELTGDQQKMLDEQLNAMIRTKYNDINYNGLNDSRLAKLFTDENGVKHNPYDTNYKYNPFDNSVVMIDEAHNFVSRISNKLNAHKSIPYVLYQYLLRADNVRIVLMTGTPMINYPNELGILFNLLRGVIRTWTFTITGNQRIVKDNIIDMFRAANFNTYDYIDYANGKLTITRNPFGFVNASLSKRGGSLSLASSFIQPATLVTTTTMVDTITGGGEEDDENETHDNTKTESKSKNYSSKKTLKRVPKKIRLEDELEKTYHKIHDKICTPPKPVKQTRRRIEKHDTFARTPELRSSVGVRGFVGEAGVSGWRAKTPTGLSRDGLPSKDNAPIEKIADTPGSNMGRYKNLDDLIHAKTPEGQMPASIDGQLEQDLQNYANSMMGDPHKGGDPIVNPQYRGVYLNEQGNISDEAFLNQVKHILRQNGVEIIGNPEVNEKRALPETQTDFLQMFLEDGTIQPTVKNINLFKKRILGLTSYFRSAQEKLLPSFVPNEKGEIYHIVPVEMSEHQIVAYNRIRTEEKSTDKKTRLMAMMKNAKDLYNTASSYRIFSRAACNFTFPESIPRPLPDKGKRGKMNEEVLDNIEDNNEADIHVGENAVATVHDKDYQTRIMETLAALKNTENEKYLKPDMLQQLSPKFLRMLENIQDPEHKGLHLVYSNFRSLEGIGIFKLVLEANGFAEFKLQRNGDIWEIKLTDPDTSKPRFVLYTGTETAEEKEIIRNIYNSQWDLVPASIANELRETAENNYYGELIRIIMITASGAEGINLANTRYVHIMEPYWNLVRIDQVVGRARRICSHKNLPEELRTVQVFLYISVFTEAQRLDPKYKDIMGSDIGKDVVVNGKVKPGKAITTDENLYAISAIKNEINQQLLNGIKETAIDCRLYKKGSSENSLVCYGEGISYATNDFGIFPSLEEDQIVVEDLNLQRKVRKMTKVTIPMPDGTSKEFAKYGNDLYDLDEYEDGREELVARLERGRFIPVGGTLVPPNPPPWGEPRFPHTPSLVRSCVRTP